MSGALRNSCANPRGDTGREETAGPTARPLLCAGASGGGDLRSGWRCGRVQSDAAQCHADRSNFVLSPNGKEL